MNRLVLLGSGYTLTRLARVESTTRDVLAVTRDPERQASLREAGAQVISLDEALDAAAEEDVVVSIPPEAGLDARIAKRLAQDPPARCVYLSSTGVYGQLKGRVDEDSPVAFDDSRAKPRLEAERLYRSFGGVVLRVAGIYGPGRGIQDRMRAGTWRIPGDGSGHVSRVHVDDLVEAIRVALRRAEPGSVLCVADDGAGTHQELAAFLSEKLGVPIPGSVPLEEVHPSLRGDREIVNARLRALGWRPNFPTFREGYEAVLAQAHTATASSRRPSGRA
ncbi:MAG: NAD-dependent epimerase/dehydratase family protein [Myxococcaceae bacterium]